MAPAHCPLGRFWPCQSCPRHRLPTHRSTYRLGLHRRRCCRRLLHAPHWPGACLLFPPSSPSLQDSAAPSAVNSGYERTVPQWPQGQYESTKRHSLVFDTFVTPFWERGVDQCAAKGPIARMRMHVTSFRQRHEACETRLYIQQEHKFGFGVPRSLRSDVQRLCHCQPRALLDRMMDGRALVSRQRMLLLKKSQTRCEVPIAMHRSEERGDVPLERVSDNTSLSLSPHGQHHRRVIMKRRENAVSSSLGRVILFVK